MTATEEFLLDVRGITVAYGSVVAVRDVSLQVRPGETVAILGANGAGKTSLLRAATGLERVRSGSVFVDGQDVTGFKPHKIASLGVAHVPDNRGLFPSLTVEENLRMGIYGAGLEDAEDLDVSRREIFDLFPILEERRTQAAGTMSGGQQQMLTIARALLQRPRLLLLDEMSMGLAPSIVDELFDIVRDLQRRGIAVVLVEQFVGQALSVADRAVVLEQGQVLARGTPDDLQKADLAAAYLGGEESVDIGVVPPPPERVAEAVPASLAPSEIRALERIADREGSTVDRILRGAVHGVLLEHGEIDE